MIKLKTFNKQKTEDPKRSIVSCTVIYRSRLNPIRMRHFFGYSSLNPHKLHVLDTLTLTSFFLLTRLLADVPHLPYKQLKSSHKIKSQQITP
jgi:hypothetical protein